MVHELSNIELALLSELNLVEASEAALVDRIGELRAELRELKADRKFRRLVPNAFHVAHVELGSNAPHVLVTVEVVSSIPITRLNTRSDETPALRWACLESTPVFLCVAAEDPKKRGENGSKQD